jgi:very-short-patch-repair endonuclease
MAENRTFQIDRISCEEEERLAIGYDIKTYFTVQGGLDRVKTVNIKDGKDNLLKLRYIPAATLIKVNDKWRARRETGFLLNLKTGFWKTEKDLEKDKDIKRIRLFTTDTADALYIHPLKALAFEKGKESDSIITFLFALKRAMENVFQIESAEIDVEVMGANDWPNILVYESSEGSLGILSQLVENVNLFREIIKEAYSVCYFKDGKDTKPKIGPATYNDLLNYYNQRYHLIIDRHLIKEQLEKLMNCELELLSSSNFSSYDEQYQSLIERIDPTSVTEKIFLEYLHKNNFRLPDSAQYTINDIYVKPDFYYKEGNVCVFCDGTPHDEHNVKESDKSKRQALINKGYDVVVYYYRDSMEDLIKQRSDIFYKVK